MKDKMFSIIKTLIIFSFIIIFVCIGVSFMMLGALICSFFDRELAMSFTKSGYLTIKSLIIKTTKLTDEFNKYE